MPLFGPPDIEKLKAKGNVKGLIKALGYEKDADVRQAAAQALGEIGDARAVEPLIVALKDASKNVRRAAARALGQIGDTRAVGALIAALKDKDVYVRQAAVGARDARAVKQFRAVFEYNYMLELHTVAAEALVEISVPAVEPLIAKLEDKDASQTAAEALVRIGVPAVGPLIAALKDARVRYAAARALVGHLARV